MYHSVNAMLGHGIWLVSQNLFFYSNKSIFIYNSLFALQVHPTYKIIYVNLDSLINVPFTIQLYNHVDIDENITSLNSDI